MAEAKTDTDPPNEPLEEELRASPNTPEWAKDKDARPKTLPVTESAPPICPA